MTITVAHVTPLVALIAGILILIVPRLLNYVVAVYLITRFHVPAINQMRDNLMYEKIKIQYASHHDTGSL